ncbi:MAG: hypothetical protein WHS82_03560 [Candidatus Methanosuratincola sp.]
MIGAVSTSPETFLIELTSKKGCTPSSALLEFLDASGIWAEWISAVDLSPNTESGVGIDGGDSGEASDKDSGLVEVSALVRSKNPIDEGVLASSLKRHLGDRLLNAKVIRAPAMSQGFPPVLKINGKERRCLLLNESDLSALFRGMQELFGTGAAVVLYNLGKDMGVRCYAASYSLVTGERETLELCLRMRQLLGFGRFKILSWEGGVPREVLVEDNIECRLTGNIPGQESALVRGYLEGAISAATEVNVRAVEEQCLRKGDRCCTFRIERV